MGGMSRCIRAYIEDLKAQYPDYDKTRCFIAYSRFPQAEAFGRASLCSHARIGW